MYQFFPENYMWTIRINGIISESYLGGGNWGEIQRVIRKLDPKDPDSWGREWDAMGDEVRRLAMQAESDGIDPLSRDRHLRAANYYQLGELFTPHRDPNKMEMYRKSLDCFHRAMAHIPNIKSVEIPYENAHMPGYFINASRNGEKRPVLVIVDGLDGTAEKMYFIAGPKCEEYGLSALCVDGPGNGGSIRLHGHTHRFDAEVPAKAIFDYLETRDDVDLNRVALMQPSLGGYSVIRAVAFEKRFAACIVYGAMFDYFKIWEGRPDNHPFAEHLRWILGVDSMAAAREKIKQYTLEDVAHLVECPTLILHGENDAQVPLSDAQKTYDLIRGPKKLRVFTEEEQADHHCQQENLLIVREEIFAWLTSIFDL
ncbi:MAG: prolyl oligopeptidase family serine peptidase [Deltaproteobacteria bacterium]|nr:prolyl oligopeptidase family serine peptidase [Deltaproteobacteria bacterium]